MPKLRVKLKQHTPIIHFQAEQSGATLRATELKPKLDKFLIKNAFNDDFNEYKEFLIGYNENKKRKDYNGKEAFDYKVKIQSENVQIIDIDKEIKNSLYFGNMGKKNYEEKKKAIYTDEDIIVDFFSFKKELINKIKKWVAPFFAVTNYGTRQNKGFGSFYIKNYDFLTELKKIKDKFLYIEYKNNNYKEMLDDVFIIYTLMKSGINYPDHPKGNYRKRGKNSSYRKSFLFKYMLDKGIGNEKRFIKENFFPPYLRIDDDGKNKKYVRGLLGISDGIAFKDKRRGEVKYKSDIDRFKSPITFKIVDNIVSIIPEEIPDEIFGKQFYFEQKFYSKRLEKELITKQKIRIPSKKEFDLESFLFAFADYFNDELEVYNVNNSFERKLRRAKKKVIIKEGDSNA